ncbi:MAG TPA: PP2C family protein-serine/threonine phosphatase [Streptosporangiaceae bacterium]|nr:PP2C family protein-serine/threonine phosphatase [Streptosporangiaceae bacterium]
MILPGLACQLRVTARAMPLQAGGDIHDALVTPFGVRLLIGDVMGTGAPAHETGRQVVAAWRELAVAEPSLPGIAVRLHTLISRSADPERFVTALLATFGCCTSGFEFVCCGHPPPLLLRGGSASFPETFPAPPLGLLDLADGWCAAVTMPFGAGDRLLLYTDGVSEARDGSGAYFGLNEAAVAASLAGGESDDDVLDLLVAALHAHLGTGQADDILLLMASR